MGVINKKIPKIEHFSKFTTPCVLVTRYLISRCIYMTMFSLALQLILYAFKENQTIVIDKYYKTDRHLTLVELSDSLLICFHHQKNASLYFLLLDCVSLEVWRIIPKYYTTDRHNVFADAVFPNFCLGYCLSQGHIWEGRVPGKECLESSF
ncbi:hypothetical protein OIU79_015738 [Salix purpurea]|uniref:Uncharacterized protein n=1 Tax=Salix purpurea TaxID=77065 RepID=A0A9Q0PCQ8_SALPP|nr:hypothetical protein OIU79_015738 [Salix purpurea]